MAETRVFSWVQTHKELVQYILTMKERQPKLIDELVQAGVTGLERENGNGSVIQLSAIDPFTFLFSIYKYDVKRCIDILQNLSASIGITAPIDVFGVPHTDPRAVWEWMRKADSNDTRIQTIWTCFEKAVAHTLNDRDFQALLNIDGLSNPKLSQGLFLIDPEYYLNLDIKTRNYLEVKYDFKVNLSSYKSYTTYMNLLGKIRELTSMTNLEISYEAGQYSNEKDTVTPHSLTAQVPIPKKANLYPDPKLNQILYGPPGTGKTYNSINLAVEIADPEFMKSPKTRNEVRDKFQDLENEGRIVFTTFHQSMSYEDFIEGIKPVTQDNGQIQYDVLDGLFKQISTFSMYNLYRFVTSKNTVIQDDDFASLYQQLLSDIEDKKGDQPYEFTTKSDSVIQLVDVSSKDNLQVKHKDSSGPQTYIVSKDRLFKLFKIYNSVEQIKNVYNDIREVIGGANTSAYYSVLRRIFEIRDTSHDSTQASKSLGLEDYDLIKVALEGFILRKEVIEATPSNGVKNYILIIDEINRGNVSQIFGELITLIEPDKRAGMKEALKVTLPYSKEKFSVPPNLYIIGTMNTADRSVEALDTALRRRFTFKEFPPLTEILDDQGNDLMAKVLCDYSMKQILTTINNRIRILLDRDHQIGHSYFLDIDDAEELMEVFNQKILPLLQEYFYGDYAKIGLVLGKGFVEKEELGVAELSDFVYDDKESLVKDNYKIRIPKDVAEFKEAIHLMMSGKNGQEQS